MTCWEILNIEITTDRKKIKSAYAKKLKITHPDDDIEAFQELKEAFDQALAYAKNDQADGSKLREEIIIWEDTNETPIAVEDDFEERIQALCQSYNTRIDVSAWKKILAESMDWDMYQYETYRECIKTLLLDYYTIMSRPVIRLLFEHFQLWETDGSYYYEAEDYIFENYAEEIYDAPDFAFDTLGDLKGVVLDQFLTLRYALYRSIKQEKFTEAEKIAEQASAIYALDADLVVLQGMILFEKGLENLQDYGATFKRSFAYFNKALRLNAKNVTARFYTILIKTKNAERLEAADRLFLKDVQGGYVLHVELLTGFIYYFGKEYGEAIPFWAELSKEQQAQIKKEWIYALRHQLKLVKQIDDMEEYRVLKMYLKESKSLIKDRFKYWNWAIQMGVYILIFAAIQGCINLMPDHSSESTPTDYEEQIGKEFRNATSAEKESQAGLIARFIVAYDKKEDASTRELFMEDDVAFSYQWEIRDAVTKPARDLFADRLNENITFADSDGQVYSLLYGNDFSELIIISENERIVKIMGAYFDPMDGELRAAIEQKME